MKKQDAISHFGTQAALSAALGVSESAISQWDEIPPIRQLQLEAATGGVLAADPDCDRFRFPKPRGRVRVMTAQQREAKEST